MILMQLPFCAIGVHRRNAHRTKHDGDSWHSKCIGCETPMIRTDGRWQRADSANAGRNRTLDAVRGIAILQVLAWHLVTPLMQKHAPIAGRMLSLTWSGVDLFFVLSGFLIGGILIKNRDATNSFGVFYARRALRIIPLYALALALFFAIWPQPFGLEYALLSQNITWAAEDTFGPGAIAMTWSLAVEEQFYLCLPMLVALCPPKRLPWALVALICIAPLVRIALHLAGLPHAAYLLLPARMDSLLLGVLVAWAQIGGRMPSVGTLRAVAGISGLLAVGLATAQLSPIGPLVGTAGYTVIALFYASCIALLITTRVRLPAGLSPLADIGLGAYSLYLFHGMIGDAAFAICGPTIWAYVAIAATCTVVAWACWRGIEKPLIAYGHARFRYHHGTEAFAGG